MKKVLITGKNSYIGTSVENWLMKESDKYSVDTIDMRGSSWVEKDFSRYDVVFHVAGIAHIKEKSSNQSLYFKVNRDLAYETAKKAKKEGVKHFILLSSMSVYGLENGKIKIDTNPRPKTAYGKSKFEAETLINDLQDEKFKVAIIRPPMVYGKNCKGNYPKLAYIAKVSPVFPKIENKRSMLHIDNLSNFILLVINNKSKGLYFPQNKEYVKTSEMVNQISKYNNRRILLTKSINFLFYIFKTKSINKIIGNLFYDLSMSKYIEDYIVYDFEDTIRQTEIVRGKM